MKKILNIVLCLLICFIFTGCSSNNKEESSVYSSSNQEVIDRSEEVEEETKPTIEEIADEEATWFKSAKFNSETNILTCKLEFRSNVGIDNGIIQMLIKSPKVSKKFIQIKFLNINLNIIMIQKINMEILKMNVFIQ